MRESIGKQKRFEVFKRDRFTCRYCGGKPPEVILHIDHILAVSKGGGDEESNLLTSCQDCNLGKGAKGLGEVLPPIEFSVEERRERLDQIREYQKLVEEENSFLEEVVEMVIRHWAVKDGQPENAEVWRVHRELDGAVFKFVQKLPMEEVMDAVNVAFGSVSRSDHQRFKFFCGVCWRKIRDREALAKGKPSCM